MIHADFELARRVESAEASIARGCAGGRPGTAILEVAGGVAVFAGAQSPTTEAIAIGLNGPVSPAEIDRLESFFRSRGARVSIDLCPLADPGLPLVAASRGTDPTVFIDFPPASEIASVRTLGRYRGCAHVQLAESPYSACAGPKLYLDRAVAVLLKEFNMYKRLLVPIDGSETARLGLEEAVRLGKSTGGRIRLIHVVNELPLMSPTMTGTVMTEIIDALREQGSRILASAEDTVRSAGLEAETRLVEAMGGPAGEQVVRDAAAWPADVIVCGTHGRRGVRRIVMGSDAEYILRHTPVPVLLVRASES